MQKLTTAFVVFVNCLLVSVAGFGQEKQQESATGDQAKIEEVFRLFAEANNFQITERYQRLMTPNSKATLVFSQFFLAGIRGPDKEVGPYPEFLKKWKPEFEKVFEENYKGKEIDSYMPMIAALSKWDRLDESMLDYMEQAKISHRPHYDEHLQKLKIEDHKASAEFKIWTNSGIIGQFSDDGVKRIDAGTLKVYFRKIEGKWLISNDMEYEGAIPDK